MRRWNALARTLRAPRGSKSYEHLLNLRRSDPLIQPSAWHDWQRIVEDSRRSQQARAHQMAMYERGLMRASRAAAEATAAALAAERNRNHEAVSPFLRPKNMDAASSDTGLKRAMHLGRLKTVDGTNPGYNSPEEGPNPPLAYTGSPHAKHHRPERCSNDSIMCFDVGYAADAAAKLGSPTLRPAVRHSPTLHGGANPLPPIVDLDGPASAHPSPAELPAYKLPDPSSPGSVMGLPLEPLDETHSFHRYSLGEGVTDTA